MGKKVVYVSSIVYLSGITDDMADIKVIGVYENYDKAIESTKNFIRIEEEAMLADNYDIDIVNYDNEWLIYESGGVYAMIVINKTLLQ